MDGRKDYYACLGLARDASDADIRTAYRNLARKYHPDANPGFAEEADRMMKLINEAYGVLSDGEKRRAYDKTLEAEDRTYTRQSSYRQAESPRQRSQVRPRGGGIFPIASLAATIAFILCVMGLFVLQVALSVGAKFAFVALQEKEEREAAAKKAEEERLEAEKAKAKKRAAARKRKKAEEETQRTAQASDHETPDQ